MDLIHVAAASEVVHCSTEPLLDVWRTSLGPSTRAAYAADLADFAKHVGAASPADACGRLLADGKIGAEQRVLGYLQHRAEERKLSPSTVARRRAALRSVVRIANGLGFVTWLLSAPLPRSARPRAYRDTRGPGLPVVRLLREVAVAQGGVKAARDLALIAILYTLGLRRAEVCSLNVASYDRTTRRLAVVGKGRTDPDLLTVPATLAVEIESYLELRGSPGGGPLFASADRARKGDGRLTPSGLAKLLQHLASKAGVTVPVSPHRLRHSAISDALDGTRGDVRRVRHFSRHVKLETVLVYDDARRDDAGELATMLSSALGRPGGAAQAEAPEQMKKEEGAVVPGNASYREQISGEK